jgi:hypothetical protein
MCKLKKKILFNFLLVSYLWPLERPSLDVNKLLYECKVLWNIIVKGILILIFKRFGIVYDYVKYMVGEWCGITIIHRK